ATEAWFALGGSQTQVETWTYDAVGNLLTARDPDGTYTLTYDALNRVATLAEPFGLSLTFGYDAAGNRTSVQDSKNGVSTVTFDALNRQSAEELGGSGITSLKESRSYDAAGRLDTETRSKWASGAWQTVGTTTHGADAARRPTGITHKDGS